MLPFLLAALFSFVFTGFVGRLGRELSRDKVGLVLLVIFAVLTVLTRNRPRPPNRAFAVHVRAAGEWL